LLNQQIYRGRGGNGLDGESGKLVDSDGKDGGDGGRGGNGGKQLFSFIRILLYQMCFLGNGGQTLSCTIHELY
jgi:hypothetical protein